MEIVIPFNQILSTVCPVFSFLAFVLFVIFITWGFYAYIRKTGDLDMCMFFAGCAIVVSLLFDGVSWWQSVQFALSNPYGVANPYEMNPWHPLMWPFYFVDWFNTYIQIKVI